jgi:hypothetical protein
MAIYVYPQEMYLVLLVLLGMEQIVFQLLFIAPQDQHGIIMDAMQLLETVLLVQLGMEQLAFLKLIHVLLGFLGMEVHVFILEFLYIPVFQDMFGMDFVAFKDLLTRLVHLDLSLMESVVLLFLLKL